MAEFIINQFRKNQFVMGQTGEIIVPGFGKKIYCIEDPSRPSELKLPDFTAIPDGVYNYTVTMSPKFGRELILLYNDSKDFGIKRHGLEWAGIRAHCGITPDNSSGCVVYGYDQVLGELKISSSKSFEQELVAYLKKTAPTGRWVISTERWAA